MTPEQIKDVCKKYSIALKHLGCEPVRESDVTGSLDHICWMCHEIPNLIDSEKFVKANRWLGFVQGVLWNQEIFPIEVLKDHNRKDVKYQEPSPEVKKWIDDFVNGDKLWYKIKKLFRN